MGEIFKKFPSSCPLNKRGAPPGYTETMELLFDAKQNTLKWVLIVEDDVEIAKDLGEGLRRGGFKSVFAANVSEAIVKLSNQHFDCILLDMRLQRGSGEQIITHVRQNNPLNEKTPIMVISGFLDADLVKRIKDQVNGILVKPFNFATLTKKLHDLIVPLGTAPEVNPPLKQAA